MEKWCLQSSSFIFDQIITKVTGNQDRHKSSVEFDFGRIRPLILELLIRPLILELLALECWKFHTFELEYLWSQLANLVFDPIHFILAGNKDVHKISDEFQFRPDQTTDYGVSCPWASKNFPIDL